MADLLPFRLLVVGVSWPPETFLYRLLQGLAQSGVDITVATATKPEQRSGAFAQRLKILPIENPKIKIVFHLLEAAITRKPCAPRDVRKIYNYANSLSIPNLITHSKRALCRRRYLSRFFSALSQLLPFAGQRWDVIYFPWNSAAIHYQLLFDWDAPVVVSCRGAQVNIAPHNPQRMDIQEGLRQTFQRAAAVHCVSEAIKREAMQYGLDPAKAWVIRPAVDPTFFHPPTQKPTHSEFRVISTGSLIWRKGYEYALMAIKALVDQGVPVQYQIVGDGPERQRIAFTIEDLGLQNHVQLLGKLSPEQVRDRLQQADAFLLSSLSEGISNAVLEAMACGVPVVTTDCGGMREAVTDGVEGFVVPARDVAALANRLLALWGNLERRLAMGSAARQRILQEFHLDRQIHEFLAMYQTVISKSTAPCRTVLH